LFAFFNSLNPRYHSLRQKDDKKVQQIHKTKENNENTRVHSLKRKPHTGLQTATYLNKKDVFRIIWLNWGVLIMTYGNLCDRENEVFQNHLQTITSFLNSRVLSSTYEVVFIFWLHNSRDNYLFNRRLNEKKLWHNPWV